MKRFVMLSTLAWLLLSVGMGLAQKIGWTQYFYVARKIFPQAKEILVLMPEDEQNVQQNAMSRAAANFQLKVKLFLYNDAISLGQKMKMMPNDGILIVADAPLTREKSSMMYILSQAKDKNISVVTASQQYVDAGALIGLVKEDGHLRVVVNLKFNQQLASKFTPEFNRKVGIIKVIQ